MTAVIALLGALLVAAVSWLGWWISGSRGSEFPGWLEAVSTLAAFSAATAAAFYAARAFVLESRREDRWDDSQLRAQAVLVAAWPAPIEYEWLYDGAQDLDYPSAIRGMVALLRNASDLPVTDVRVTFSLVLLEDDSAATPVPIGSSGFGVERVAILPPATEPVEVRLRTVSEVDLVQVPDRDEASRTEMRIDIEFRDTAGRRWKRLSGGDLTLAE